MSIEFINSAFRARFMQTGKTLSASHGDALKLVNDCRRFVDEVNYTDNFGFQWNGFRITQLDKPDRDGDQSTSRFMAVTKSKKSDMKNENILGVGSAVDRFTHAVLKSTGDAGIKTS